MDVNVKDGISTSFWFDIGQIYMGCLFDLVKSKGLYRDGVSELQLQWCLLKLGAKELTLSKSTTWSRQLWRAKCLIWLTRLVSPSLQKQKDTYRSHLSTKTYEPKHMNLVPCEYRTMQWHSGIWFQYTKLKYAFCTYVALRNRLTIGDRMVTWNSRKSRLCTFCQQESEIRDHIFFDCVFSAEVWSLLPKDLLGSQFTSAWGDLIQLIMDTNHDKKSRFLLRYTFLIRLHSMEGEKR